MSDAWILFLFFAFVMGAVSVIGYVFLARSSQPRALEIPSTLSNEPALPPARAAFLDLFRSIGDSFPNAKKEHNPYRLRLSLAGYRWPSAVSVFYGIKFATTLFLAGAVGVSSLVFGGNPSGLPLAMLCGAGVGFLLPDRILRSRMRARARRLRKGLPPALDLLVLGLEAGQSLDSTVADASRGLKNVHPDLSAEFAQLYLELRASNSRVEAFHNLADRTQETELRKLSHLLIDSDRFGVSLGPALKSHNRYLRTRFRQQAQESARKVGVKLIFPVFFLIFPSVLLVTLGPACIMMLKQLQSLMQ
jgi:tight adherence protein C